MGKGVRYELMRRVREEKMEDHELELRKVREDHEREVRELEGMERPLSSDAQCAASY